MKNNIKIRRFPNKIGKAEKFTIQNDGKLQFGLVILAKLWYTNSNLKGWEDKNYGKTYYWRYRFR